MAAPGLAEEVIARDEEAVTAEFIAFLKAATAKRYGSGARRRFNQARATACVDAEFTVLDDLRPEHRVGLFATPRTYAASIRFANAASTSDRERDIRGMSVRCHRRRPAEPDAGSHRSGLRPEQPSGDDGRRYPRLPRAAPGQRGRRVSAVDVLPRHIRRRCASRLAARANPTCHLDIPYWSTTPYLFGPGRAVKYIVAPTSSRRSSLPPVLTDTYLKDAMRARLAESEATFDFMIQFQTDAARMPIEDASVEWKHQESPYIPVARIRIPPQSFDDPVRVATCEQTAFNPWHCLPEHRPLGGMNRARRGIYEAMAAFRNETVAT